MSLIHFHAEASSIEDLKRQLREALGEDTPTIQPHLLNQCIDAPTKEMLDRLTTKTGGSTEPVTDEEPQPKFVTQDIAKDLPSIQPKVEPDSNEEPEQEEPVKTYSLVEVRAQANAYRDKHGIEKLREIFRVHGGEKLKDIPESSYAALMDDLRNLMKEDA